MKAALRKAWQARAPGERTAIAVLAAIVCLAAYALLVHSATRGREQLRGSVASLQTQAALLEQQADEYARLRSAPAAPASPTDLRTLVQARVDASHLSGAVTRMDAMDAEHLQITFGAVSFADWLAWIGALQAQHVSLETARIEALTAPGLVGITATLARAKAQ
jgi:type II secretory pathway component PulM